ncbi:MAG: AAA family ATPase, partial [Candidatus Altiarchaeota archaeon]|nr:AAA family ATPase [Candidatus Altiarchaeota archaeon]
TEARVLLFKFHTSSRPVDQSVDFEKLADLTGGFSSADVKAVCDSAAEIPWIAALEGKGERPISMADFIKAVSTRTSSLKPWFILAEQQIKASGEADLYQDLLDDVQKQKPQRAVDSGVDGQAAHGDLLVEDLLRQKAEIESMIELAKSKYHKRELDEESFREITRDDQKKLIEIESKLNKLSESRALSDFERRKSELSKVYSTNVSCSVRRLYLPLLKVSAECMPRKGQISRVINKNYFFIGLNDGNIYYSHVKDLKEKVVSAVKKDDFKLPALDKFSLLSLTKLSFSAISVLGYLMSVSKVKYNDLDPASQKAAEELTSNGYAWIYIPGEDEPLLKSLGQGLLDAMFNVHRSAYYVRSLLSMPRFNNPSYHLSNLLVESEVFESSYIIVKINHTPDKLSQLLGILFNSRVLLHEIVYLPILECVYHYLGKDEFDVRIVSALRGVHSPKKYEGAYRPEPMLLGTVGYGLNSTPLESAAIKFSNVAGMDLVKEELNKAIIYPLTNPSLSQEFKHKAGGGILMYGPPGCGKTYIMRATVGEAGVNFYTVDIPDILDHTTEAGSERLHDIFNEVRSSAPSILFFDEIDALGGKRSMQSTSSRFIVNQLLTEMSGIEESNDNVLIVGATNAPWDVDPALRRSGRFTTKVFIPPPDLKSRVSLFKMYTQKIPVDSKVDYNRLAEVTEYFSSSDIAAVCDKAAEIPWSESMKGMAKRSLCMDDFMVVLSEWSSSIIPWFNLAEQQLNASGEMDLYPELKRLIDEFRKTARQ